MDFFIQMTSQSYFAIVTTLCFGNGTKHRTPTSFLNDFYPVLNYLFNIFFYLFILSFSLFLYLFLLI